MEKQNKPKSSKRTLVVLIILGVILLVINTVKVSKSDYVSKTEDFYMSLYVNFYSKICLPREISENVWLNDIGCEDKQIVYTYQIMEELDQERISIFEMLMKQDIINQLNEDPENGILFDKGYVFMYKFLDSESNVICSFVLNQEELDNNKNIHYL